MLYIKRHAVSISRGIYCAEFSRYAAYLWLIKNHPAFQPSVFPLSIADISLDIGEILFEEAQEVGFCVFAVVHGKAHIYEFVHLD